MRSVRAWGIILCLCFFAGFTVPRAGAQDRRAVLDRGNIWVRGIPGLGNNVLPALFGEYRLELSAGEDAGEAETGEPRCRIWLCGEALTFPGDSWQRRTQIAGVPIVQKEEESARLLGFSFSGGTALGVWTAVMQFPPETAGLDEPGINALIGRWLNRFLYFLSLIKSPADVSLPAVFTF
ncbi:MAG: hypothetical protein LBL28_06215 [Treponema sp.]|nr:hypothetical protein [Treponema sp.]